jgi:hypothetical protein
MPLIDELPPSVRPLGQAMTRRAACRWGTVTVSQVSGPLQSVGAAGMAISGTSSGGPPSSTSTLVDGSSLRRAATTLPALPAPTTM